MRVVLYMVTRNNAYSYLDCTLSHNVPLMDETFVVDDDSSDDTVEILRSHGVKYLQKPDFIPGLESDETTLRYFAWIALFDSLELEEDDWVVSLDPNDILYGDISRTVRILHAGAFKGAELKADYVWGENPPMKRVDGLWDSLRLVRMSAAVSGPQTFGPNQRLPQRAYEGECFSGELPLKIFNLSYLTEVDRLRAHDELGRKVGFENIHVRSVLQEPVCVPCDDAPHIWAGVK